MSLRWLKRMDSTGWYNIVNSKNLNFKKKKTKIRIVLGFRTIRKIRILWKFPQGDHWDVVNRGQKRPFQAINYWPQDGRGQNTLEHPCSVPITSTFLNRFSCKHVISHKYEGLITWFLSKITFSRKKSDVVNSFWKFLKNRWKISTFIFSIET